MFKPILSTALALGLAFPATAQQSDESRNFVEVTGEGQAEAAPDGFTLNLRIEERAPGREEAVENLAGKLNEVRAAMNGMDGIDESQVTSGSAEIGEVLPSACQQYYRDDETDPPARCDPVAHTAGMNLEIKGRPADKAGDALSLLSEFDVASVNFAGFWLEKKSDLTQVARREAVQNALASARDLAEGAELTLG